MIEVIATLRPTDQGFEEAFLRTNFEYERGVLGIPTSPGWKKVTLTPEKPFDLELLTLLCGSLAKLESEYRRVLCFYHKGWDLYVANFWDGDGAVLIYGPDFICLNDDSKKDYTWIFNPTWHEDIPDDYYYEDELIDD